jgi:hypothetical protein
LSNGLHRSDTRCLQYLKKLTKVTNTRNYLISSNKNLILNEKQFIA